MSGISEELIKSPADAQPREFDPDGGDMGRGCLISREEFEAMEAPEGYQPFEIPCDLGNQRIFPIYSASGALTSQRWRGFIKEENGKHYVLAFEAYY